MRISALRNRFLDYVPDYKLKARFIIVGIWNTIFGYLVYLGLETYLSKVLVTSFYAYMLSMLLSNVLSITNAFIFHKWYTFRSQVKGEQIIFEFAKFTITYVFTILLSLILLPIFVELFSINTKISGALVVLCCVIFSYSGHRHFSFRV